MFGSFTAEAAPLFIEWFELHRMFGVTDFTLYNATAQLSADVQRVFDYYTKRGLLQLHQIQPPDFARHVKNRYAADLGMRLALNDCMYRNMYRYRYIVVVDLDEILVPLQHRSYQQLMAQRQQPVGIAGRRVQALAERSAIARTDPDLVDAGAAFERPADGLFAATVPHDKQPRQRWQRLGTGG